MQRRYIWVLPGGAEMKLRGRQIEVFQAVMEANTLTDAANRTVALYGNCTTGGAVSVVSARTTVNYVRLS